MSLLKNINWSPSRYREAAALAKEAGEEMLSRLDWMTVKPRVVLDIGCGTGEMSSRLQQRYPDATIIALDQTSAMLTYAKEQTGIRIGVCADAAQLPIATNSVDLIFANFFLPWQEEMQKILQAWRRVLRPDGLVMLNAFGPDTLIECQEIVNRDAIPHRVDMHEIGDLLLKAGFVDPVLDVNYYTMTYRTKEKLLADLRDSGMLAKSPEHLNLSLPSTAEKWALTYEVVYAHAFVPSSQAAEADGTVKIPVANIKRHVTQS